MSTLRTVPIAQIELSPGNVRDDLGDVSELAASIKSVGLLQPITIEPKADGAGGYVVVFGNRRFAALQKLGNKETEALVRDDLTEQSRLETQLIENLQREDLTPMEEAQTYQRLITDVGLSQRDLASRLGISQPVISKRLGLLKLPDELKARVTKGKLSVTAAQEIAKVKDPKEAIELADAADDEWVDIPGEVGAILAREENEAKIEAKVEELTKQGITVTTNRSEDYPRSKAIGKGTMEGLDNITVAKHAKDHAEGHVAHVTQAATVVYLCTAPTVHQKEAPAAPESKEDQLAAKRQEKAEGSARREKDKANAQRDATRARRAFLSEAIGKRVNAAQRTEVVGLGFLLAANSDPTKLALQALGIDAPKNAHGFVDHRKHLVEYALKGDTELERATLALAFGYMEQSVGGYITDGLKDAPKRWLLFLQGQGYAVSDAERDQVGLEKGQRGGGRSPAKSARKAPKASRKPTRKAPARRKSAAKGKVPAKA